MNNQTHKKFFLFSLFFFEIYACLLSASLRLTNLGQEEGPDFYFFDCAQETPNQSIIEPISPDLINLEKISQDFILELKQIEIPNYPNSFNPGITRWRGNLLLTFRIRDSKTQLTNQIGMIWLDENFNLASPPYVVQIPPTLITRISKEQDPRLITIGDRLFMVYSNIIPGTIIREVRRVFVTEVHFDGKTFFTDPPECLSFFENEKEQCWEKNWVPFEYKNNLLLAYSIVPHRIFRLLGNGASETCASTVGLIDWKWGGLRGGTPAVLDDGQYLAFFHSSTLMATVHSNGKKIQHYFMGAYTFSSEPPFAITKASPQPIIGNNFYSSPPYKTWKPLRVVFPGGIIIDENFVWVVYGRQDFELWVMKLDKKSLLNSLMPVTTIFKN